MRSGSHQQGSHQRHPSHAGDCHPQHQGPRPYDLGEVTWQLWPFALPLHRRPRQVQSQGSRDLRQLLPQSLGLGEHGLLRHLGSTTSAPMICSSRWCFGTLQPRHQGICIMKNSYCNIPLVSFFKGLILMFSGCMCTYGTTAASTISGCVWSRLSSSAGGTWMKHILCHQDSGEKASWHWKSVTDALLGHGIIIAN